MEILLRGLESIDGNDQSLKILSIVKVEYGLLMTWQATQVISRRIVFVGEMGLSIDLFFSYMMNPFSKW